MLAYWDQLHRIAVAWQTAVFGLVVAGLIGILTAPGTPLANHSPADSPIWKWHPVWAIEAQRPLLLLSSNVARDDEYSFAVTTHRPPRSWWTPTAIFTLVGIFIFAITAYYLAMYLMTCLRLAVEAKNWASHCVDGGAPLVVARWWQPPWILIPIEAMFSVNVLVVVGSLYLSGRASLLPDPLMGILFFMLLCAGVLSGWGCYILWQIDKALANQ